MEEEVGIEVLRKKIYMFFFLLSCFTIFSLISLTVHFIPNVVII